MCLLAQFHFHCQASVSLHSNITLKQALQELLMGNNFLCPLLSKNGSRNPFWYCFYSADARLQPLWDHELSPARPTHCPPRALLFPSSLPSRSRTSSASPAYMYNEYTLGSSQASAVGKVFSWCRGTGTVRAERFGIIIRISVPIPNSLFIQAARGVPDHHS